MPNKNCKKNSIKHFSESSMFYFVLLSSTVKILIGWFTGCHLYLLSRFALQHFVPTTIMCSRTSGSNVNQYLMIDEILLTVKSSVKWDSVICNWRETHKISWHVLFAGLAILSNLKDPGTPVPLDCFKLLFCWLPVS